MINAVGLRLDPLENAVALCVDEKSQIQALDRSAPVLPMRHTWGLFNGLFKHSWKDWH